MIIDMKAVLIAAGAAFAVGLAAGGSGAWIARGWKADSAMSDLQATYARAYAASSEQAREKESTLQKIADDLRAKVPDEDAKTNADAVAADGSADGVRDAARVLAAGVSCNTAAEQRGKTATSAAGVLSDLLAECSATKSAVAREAEQYRNAGLRCEAQYDRIRDEMNKPHQKP